jgi:hypothetical protein
MSTTADTSRQITLSWAEGKSATVASVDELDERLDALDAEAREGDPFVAEVARPDGAVLSIGLGRDASVLNYSASPDPPYYTSHSPGGSGDESPVFYYYGHWSEFRPDAAVPMENAREAVRVFFRTGDRPDNIDWRQD